MRATSSNIRLQTVLVGLLAMLQLTAAWPVWPRWLPELDSLIVRADSSSSSSAPQPTTLSVTKTSSGSATATNSDDNNSASTTASGSNSKSASKTSGSSASGSGSDTITSAPTSTTYDDTLPAGGISMLTPAVVAGAQYYKIGQQVTFVWNYTSLEATPTAVNIMATCTANKQLYTIAANQTVGNSTGVVTWDTGAYQSTALAEPLLTETYTLVIYDAASSISATAQAGYLDTFDTYTFGMYVPQAYVGLDDGYVCVTCSGAMSDMQRKALGMVFGVGLLTVLSFTWFVAGTEVVW